MRNDKNSNIIKPSIDRYGYYKISYIDRDGKKWCKTIHRIVAETWIHRTDINLQVNHKDGNKLNNYINNLEWVTASENIIHSFSNLLNTNTIQVQLLDLENNKRFEFRSIKELCKYLSINYSSLLPLIRNSKINPIYGRFVITVVDEISMLKTANSNNFGRNIYVYDCLNKEYNTYVSILMESYFTGIRSLKNIKSPSLIIGYYITFDKLDNNIPIIDNDKTINERFIYVTTPYKKQPTSYYTYNYYTKNEYCFNNLEDISKYLSDVMFGGKHITKSIISCSIHAGINSNRTGLIRGIGVKSSFQDIQWYQYTEEYILNSMNRYPSHTRVYKITIGNNEKITFGKYQLCKYLNYSPDKLLCNISYEEIIKSSNIPNLSVKRLNLPIK